MAEYVDIEKAIGMTGLRVILPPGVPGPWGEAVKGILHVKKIPFTRVRHDRTNYAPLLRWSEQSNSPVVVYNDERPRGVWRGVDLEPGAKMGLHRPVVRSAAHRHAGQDQVDPVLGRPLDPLGHQRRGRRHDQLDRVLDHATRLEHQDVLGAGADVDREEAWVGHQRAPFKASSDLTFRSFGSPCRASPAWSAQNATVR